MPPRLERSPTEAPAGSSAAVPALHDTGRGPAVLLLHAFPLDASQWDHQVAALSDRHRCLRPDFWGCGQSPPPSGPATLDGFVIALLGELDRLRVDRVAVVGLSMGGYLAFTLWRLAPQRVAALVLADTRSAADSPAAAEERLATAERVRREGVEWLVETTVERLLGPGGRRDSHVADPVRGRIRRCRPEGVSACLEAMAARPDSQSLLAQVTVPTLVVAGEHDATSTPESMRQLAGAIPGARFALIRDAGHLSNLEQPAEFSARLGEFLSENWAGGG